MKIIAAGITGLILAITGYGGSAAAQTKTRSIYFPAAAMNVLPIVRDDVLDPTLLSDTANSQFRVSFVTPADHVTNTPITVRLVFWTSTSCTIIFGAQYVDRTRIGKSTYETSSPNHDGVTGANITTLDLPAGVTKLKSITVRAPSNAPFVGQRPGDSVLFLFKRLKTNPLDTCGLVTLWSAEIRYTAAY